MNIKEKNKLIIYLDDAGMPRKYRDIEKILDDKHITDLCMSKAEHYRKFQEWKNGTGAHWFANTPKSKRCICMND